MSQKALAAELGVSPAYISQVFSGKKNPPDLGRPKSRSLLRKWSRFLQASEEVLLDMVRHDLHRVPMRPAARFPGMRDLLCGRVLASSRGLVDEMKSMPLHPAENAAVQVLVQVYFVQREDWGHGRIDGARRFRDLACRARSNREFVDGELLGFWREHDFRWSWDPDTNEVMFDWRSADAQDALERVAAVLGTAPGPAPGCTIPVVGHVSAGEGFEYTDGGFIAGEGFEQVEIPPGIAPGLARSLYCVRVRGDSLRDFFGDGALLFIKPESWEEIRDGDLVIFKDRQGMKAFVKKVEFAGDSLILKSMNPLYKNMVLRRTELVLLERVMAVVL